MASSASLIGLGGALAALAACPFGLEFLRPARPMRLNASDPGQFADLDCGRTYYRWRGPEDGPVAVCIHGLTTPSYVWDPIAEWMAERGFRVLTYDLYGRGLTDPFRGPQTRATFCAQLEQLLASLGVSSKFVLFGYSMGGGIATAYAARHPERLTGLCLIAPVGFGHNLGWLSRFATCSGWVGHWAMVAFFPGQLRRATDADRALPCPIPNMVDRQIDEARWRGFAPTILGSLKGLLSEDFEPDHRAIATAGVPCLTFWGAADTVIPLSGQQALALWNPAARQVVLAGVPHSMAYTQSDRITRLLVPWLTPALTSLPCN